MALTFISGSSFTGTHSARASLQGLKARKLALRGLQLLIDALEAEPPQEGKILKDWTLAATAGAMLSTLLADTPSHLDPATLLGTNLDVLLTWFFAIAIAVSIGLPGTVIAASLASGAVFGLWIGQLW